MLGPALVWEPVKPEIHAWPPVAELMDRGLVSVA
jgi:hypothetical protein